MGMQLFFVATFAFMMLEALQAYAVCTNVISGKGYFKRLEAFVIGWGIAAVVTGISAVLKHDEYISYWS